MSTPNTNELTYNSYIQQVCTLAVYEWTVINNVVTPVDTAVQFLIPSMLNYAEIRIQRDLDVLPSQTSNTSYSTTAGTNTVSLSVNDFQTIQTVACTVGTARVPLLPVSKEYIQAVYNDSAATYQGPPSLFAVYGGDAATGGNTSNILLFGPYPDQVYPLTITGTQWLPSLFIASTQGFANTQATYISSNYPDLLIQASLIYLALFQRNFSAMSSANDPMMAGSYEYQYGVLLKSAIESENRKKFRDAAWSSQSQSPVATPTR